MSSSQDRRREGYEETEFERLEPRRSADGTFDYTPEELRQWMGEASSTYHIASRRMAELQVAKTIRTEKSTIIMGARRWDLLTNRRLADHLADTFRQTPNLKPTKEQYAAWIHVEHQAIFDEYLYWEAEAKRAEREHEMWSRQLSWHQSILKHEGIEMSTLNMQRG